MCRTGGALGYPKWWAEASYHRNFLYTTGTTLCTNLAYMSTLLGQILVPLAWPLLSCYTGEGSGCCCHVFCGPCSVQNKWKWCCEKARENNFNHRNSEKVLSEVLLPDMETLCFCIVGRKQIAHRLSISVERPPYTSSPLVKCVIFYLVLPSHTVSQMLF